MEIREIKQRLTFQEVLNHYHLKPTAKGALQCPFPCHPETKPGTKKKTLQIYTDTHRYQCFHKDCPAGNGDVIDFIEHMEQCSKHEAIEKAKILLGEVPTPNSDAHSDAPDRDRKASGSPSGVPTTPGTPGTGTTSHFEIESPEQLHYQDAHLAITVMGGIKLEGLDRMRVTLRINTIKHPHQRPLRDTLDLYRPKISLQV